MHKSLSQDKFRSCFLSESDGFAPNGEILFLATTNHADKLAPALVQRPSSLDRKYLFSLPAETERLNYMQNWNQELEDALTFSKEAYSQHREFFPTLSSKSYLSREW